VRLHHVGRGPGDRPSARSILAAVHMEQRSTE
jgi:hypothetical protein